MRQWQPKFDLNRVKAATAADVFTLGRTRCLDILVAYLGDHQSSRRFVQTLVKHLSASDFNEAKDLGDDWFDEYGIELPSPLLSELGLDDATWYVKLTLRNEGSWGDEAFYLSVHPLEKPMLYRAGGPLFPKTRQQS